MSGECNEKDAWSPIIHPITSMLCSILRVVSDGGLEIRRAETVDVYTETRYDPVAMQTLYLPPRVCRSGLI